MNYRWNRQTIIDHYNIKRDKDMYISAPSIRQLSRLGLKHHTSSEKHSREAYTRKRIWTIANKNKKKSSAKQKEKFSRNDHNGERLAN